LARSEPQDDYTETFFVCEVLGGLAGELGQTAAALRDAAGSGALPSRRRLLQLHTRLVRIFQAELSVFERKRFVSLSHEANKAMNLNSYLSLMGGAWVDDATPPGLVLRPAGPDDWPDLVVPDSDYVLTLDADSMLLREYCLRLVHQLETAGNERVAIIQTPYSSYPGAPTELERVAGATTDLQHLQHQGKTHYGATFWVGANAVIRRHALEDIVQVHDEGGFPIRTYVQDRTVIEDTESSIDLRANGWELVNFPERLSYSATPPDFGSLVVQRRLGAPLRRSEVLLRLDYLGSIAWSSLGLVLLLTLPEAMTVLSPVVFLASVPYFAAMAADLRTSGYRARDVFAIYALNLVLLAVNSAGVLKSLQQAATGRKIPFARTPKVRDRTAAPALYALLPWVIAAYFAMTAYNHAYDGTWGGFAFSTVSGALTLWGAVTFVGVRETMADVRLGVGGRLRRIAVGRPVPAARPQPATSVDGAAFLYFGEHHRLAQVPAEASAGTAVSSPAESLALPTQGGLALAGG